LPPRLVLGIETSCDDTAAAVVSSDGLLLGEALASQARSLFFAVSPLFPPFRPFLPSSTSLTLHALSSQSALHAPYGGVVPKLAQGAHASAIDAVVASALSRAGVPASSLSAVAVTVGPGLSMCLRVGVLKARAMAAALRVPLVPVHHMEAHALVARLAPEEQRLAFPFVALLVSGGHNLLVLSRGVGDHVILGATLDDAAGEAFDKTARLLRLPVGGGGGPALEALARAGDASRFPFPVPLRGRGPHRETCDFSFAGLKTSARMRIAAELGLPTDARPVEYDAAAAPPALEEIAFSAEQERARADIAAAFQAAAVTHLAERTARALAWAKRLAPDASALVVAGGVASNGAVRAALRAACDAQGFTLAAPPPAWCTDNGAMVAWAGVERLALGLSEAPPPVSAEAASSLSGDDTWRFADHGEFVPLLPRWPLGERHPDAVAALSGVRSLRKVRLAAPLAAGAMPPPHAA
jgi:glycoprotease/Kae1 family metallohydrolase